MGRNKTVERKNMANKDDNKIYKVVVNPEGKYSTQPVDEKTPPGWKDEGKTGTLVDCIDYIEEVWTETMR